MYVYSSVSHFTCSSPNAQGHEISEILGYKAGKAVKDLLEAVVVWQLDHPAGTKDECSQWFRESVDSGQFASVLGTDSRKKAKVAP